MVVRNSVSMCVSMSHFVSQPQAVLVKTRYIQIELIKHQFIVLFLLIVVTVWEQREHIWQLTISLNDIKSNWKKNLFHRGRNQLMLMFVVIFEDHREHTLLWMQGRKGRRRQRLSGELILIAMVIENDHKNVKRIYLAMNYEL